MGTGDSSPHLFCVAIGMRIASSRSDCMIVAWQFIARNSSEGDPSRRVRCPSAIVAPDRDCDLEGHPIDQRRIIDLDPPNVS